MQTNTATTPTDSLIQPPSGLLTTVIDPNTQQPTYAFPLQTTAWLKMQTVVNTALAFPLSSDQFTSLYGTFTDEGIVEQAVTILGAIQQTATEYGDPATLISELAGFQQADTAPDSIYGNAVWLAARTQLAAQQIASLLQIGLTDIGQTSDPATRIQELTELLTGQGGITSLAAALQTDITNFQTKTGTFYQTLNQELTGQTNSLQWYLSQSSNVLSVAQADVSADETQVKTLTDNINELNKEYIGFTVAASVSPVFVLFPFFGLFIAIADATTFGVLAAKVKAQMDALNEQLKGVEADEQKKTALVTQLTGFNTASLDVETDGKAFLDTIGQLISGWAEFTSQINLRLTSLTPDDVANWSAFLDKIGFQSALAGWQLIAAKAESFFQTGFVAFSTAPATDSARTAS